MSAEALLSEISGTLDLEGTLRHLRLPDICRKNVTSHWFPKSVVTAGVAGSPHHLFRTQDLDAFLKTLLEKADPQLSDSRALKSIDRTSKATGTKCGDILGLIFDGKLRRIGLRSGGIAVERLLVDPAEVSGLLRPKVCDELSRMEVKRILGVRMDVVNALIDIGALEGVVSRSTHNRPRVAVRRSELDGFRSRYVSVASVADEFGIGLQSTIKALAEAGLQPSFSPEKVRQHYYDRSKIETMEVLNSHVRRPL